jgi:hypothetical protein
MTRVTKTQALAAAARFGFVLDEDNSGSEPLGGYTAILDHPTHSIGNDCRSITETSYPPRAADFVWASILERVQAEGPLLKRCIDPECEYHHNHEEGEGPC